MVQKKRGPQKEIPCRCRQPARSLPRNPLPPPQVSNEAKDSIVGRQLHDLSDHSRDKISESEALTAWRRQVRRNHACSGPVPFAAPRFFGAARAVLCLGVHATSEGDPPLRTVFAAPVSAPDAGRGTRLQHGG
jgi:hypothetical protein